MKKTKLVALMLTASMVLTACGTNKVGLFAGVKAANRVGVTGEISVYTSDEAYTREMANLINQLEFTEGEYLDRSEMTQEEISSGFRLEFYVDSKDGKSKATKYINFVSPDYCEDDSRQRYYQITSADDTIYGRLMQLAYKLKAQDEDYIARLNNMNNSNTVVNGQLQQDTNNPNYQEWIKGMCSELAAVPDRGILRLYDNAYSRNESSYIFDDLSKEDFAYLVEKYQNEGFDRDVIRTDNGFFAYSSNTTYDYIGMRGLEDGCVLLTLGRDLNLVDASASQWEDAAYGAYLPKPEIGQCVVVYDHPTPCPALDNDSYTEFIVTDVDKKQAEEYIEVCRQNGYTGPEDVSSSDDEEISWTGHSADGKIYIKVMRKYQSGYMNISVGEN